MNRKPLSKNALRTLKALRDGNLIDGNFFYGDAHVSRTAARTRGIAELVERHVIYLDYEVYRESSRGREVKT